MREVVVLLHEFFVSELFEPIESNRYDSPGELDSDLADACHLLDLYGWWCLRVHVSRGLRLCFSERHFIKRT